MIATPQTVSGENKLTAVKCNNATAKRKRNSEADKTHLKTIVSALITMMKKKFFFFIQYGHDFTTDGVAIDIQEVVSLISYKGNCSLD